MKSYTDLEQSKKLAEILPLESADMTLPFRHTKDDKYLPGYVGTRSYIDVYNDMIVLPGMDKEEVCKLIQPCWSLAALLSVLPEEISLNSFKDGNWNALVQQHDGRMIYEDKDNPVDACYELILKLHELKML